MTVLPMFPREHQFTSRKVAANLSHGPQSYPEAAMIEWAEDHDAPNINTAHHMTEDEYCERMIKRYCLIAIVVIPAVIELATALGIRV